MEGRLKVWIYTLSANRRDDLQIILELELLRLLLEGFGRRESEEVESVIVKVKRSTSPIFTTSVGTGGR